MAKFYRKRATLKLASGNGSLADMKLWTPAGAIIYCYSVITTIGWGNIVPATINGRLGTVIYGLNGMPLLFTLSSEVGNSCSRIIFTSWATFRKTILPSATLKNLAAILGFKPPAGAYASSRPRRTSSGLSDEDNDDDDEDEDEDEDIKTQNISGNQCSFNPSVFLSHVTNVVRPDNISYPPKQGQQSPLDRGRRLQELKSSSAYLASPQSCIDFFLYAHNEIHQGRAPQENARFRIKTKQDALLLCRYFHRMTAVEHIKCMEYVGFNFPKEDVRLVNSDSSGVVTSSRSHTCGVRDINFDKVLQSNQVLRGTIFHPVAHCTIGVHKHWHPHNHWQETLPVASSPQTAKARFDGLQRVTTTLDDPHNIVTRSLNSREVMHVCSREIDKKNYMSVSTRKESRNNPERIKRSRYSFRLNGSEDFFYWCKCVIQADSQQSLRTLNVKEHRAREERVTESDLCDTNRGLSINSDTLILQVPSNSDKWRSGSPVSQVSGTETSLKIKFSDSPKSKTDKDGPATQQIEYKCLNKASTGTYDVGVSQLSKENVASLVSGKSTIQMRNQEISAPVLVFKNSMTEPETTKGTGSDHAVGVLAEKTGDSRPPEMQTRNVHVSKMPAHITDPDSAPFCFINTTSMKHTDAHSLFIKRIHAKSKYQHMPVGNFEHTMTANTVHILPDVAKSVIQVWEVNDQGRLNLAKLSHLAKPRESEIGNQDVYAGIEHGVQGYQGASSYDPSPMACQIRHGSVHDHRRTTCQLIPVSVLENESTTYRPRPEFTLVNRESLCLAGCQHLTNEHSSPGCEDNYSGSDVKHYLQENYKILDMSKDFENQNANISQIKTSGVDKKQATNFYSFAELASSMKSKIQLTASKVGRFLLRKALTITKNDQNQCVKLQSWKRKDKPVTTAKEWFFPTAVEAPHGGKPSFQICPEICQAENVDTFVSIVDGFCVKDLNGHFSFSETEMTLASSQVSVGVRSSANYPHDKTRSVREKHCDNEAHAAKKTLPIDLYRDIDTYLFSSLTSVKPEDVLDQADVISIDREQNHKHSTCLQKCCSQKASLKEKYSFLEEPCNTIHSILEAPCNKKHSILEAPCNTILLNKKITSGTPRYNKMPDLSRSDKSGKYLSTGECSRLVETARSNYNTNSDINDYEDGYFCSPFSRRLLDIEEDDEDDEEFISGRGFGFDVTKAEQAIKTVIVSAPVEEDLNFTFGSLGYIFRPVKKSGPMLERFHMPLYIMYAIVLVYVLLGSLVFFTWEGDHGFWDSLYFIYVMLSTTGFGDLLPSPKMYAFVVVYAVIGMALYNIMINATLELFLEVFEFLSTVGQPKKEIALNQ